jgi:DNA polymerase delta subunit 1
MNEELIIGHSYDFKEYQSIDNVDIFCWFLNKNSEPGLIIFQNYSPSCYIELPNFYTYFKNGEPMKDYFSDSFWTRSNIDLYLSQLKIQTMAEFSESPTVNLRYKLYFHSDTKKKFVHLKFKTARDMFYLTSFLEKGNKKSAKSQYGIEINDDGKYFKAIPHENKLITTTCKMITEKNMKTCQWFKIKGERVDNDCKISTLKNEYICDYNNIEAIPLSETQSWMTHPVVLVFDIETYSYNHNSFPDALKSKDVAYMISCITQQFKKRETRKRYCIIFGDYTRILAKKTPAEIDDIENSIIIKVNSEKELIDKFCDIIIEEDPTVMSGYNILCFDYMYLNTRLERLNNKWKNISRLLYVPPENVKQKFESKAYGKNPFDYIDIPGRINIDLFPLIKREHGKLDSYGLGFVANYFLGRTKHDISAKEMFKIFSNIISKTISQKKKDRAKIQMYKVILYCIQDSELVMDLFDKLNIWISSIEMANIVGVTISETFTRGQQIRCVSQLYTMCYSKGYIVNTIEKYIGQGYDGAFVFDPVPGLYECITCLDFSSLYPSIIQAFNICYSTYVHPDSYEDYEDDDLIIIKNTVDINAEHNKKQSKKKVKELLPPEFKTYVFKFVKKSIREGLLPALEYNLISERNKIKKKIKEINKKEVKTFDDEVSLISYDARQLAIKCSANSFYGFLGTGEKGKLPFMEGATCVTSLGRTLISHVFKKIQEEWGGTAVYGDTDSCMIDLQIKDRKECHRIGNALAQFINGAKKGDIDYKNGGFIQNDIEPLFPEPLKMEFEKSMKILCIKKKCYAYILIDKNGEYIRKANGDLDIQSKGIALSRRDKCKFLKRVYEKVLQMIFSGKLFDEVILYMFDEFKKLLNGEINTKELLLVCLINDTYKQENNSVNVFKKRMEAEGKTFVVGEKVQFLILANGGIKTGEKMCILEDYDNGEFEIDFIYYLQKRIIGNIDTLINIAYKNEIAKINLEYKKSSRCRVSSNNILSSLVFELEKGNTIDAFYQDFIKGKF